MRFVFVITISCAFFGIQTMNKISPVGLNRFDAALYEVGDEVQDPQGILVRSAKLLDMEFNPGLLAIARAAVADPPVMILDETNSSIDTRTEALVQSGMDKLMEGRTVFVIAHRLSTVKNADVIMVLDHGRIIERGNHAKLIAEKGVYYQLYTGAFELE